MKMLDLLTEIMNENLTEEQKQNGEKFERLHSKPVELVETPNGIRHRDIKSGQFTNK